MLARVLTAGCVLALGWAAGALALQSSYVFAVAGSSARRRDD